MRKSLLCVGAVLLAALVVGCSDTGPSPNPARPSLAAGISTTAAKPDSQAPQTVPREVHGTLDGTLTFAPSATAPEGFITNGEATGTLSHLGLTRMSITHAPTMAGEILDGSFTIVAANGNTITGRYEGYGKYMDPPTKVQCWVTFEITGGTGRFLHATGTLPVTFIETLAATDPDPFKWVFPITWTITGTVNY